MQKIILFIKKVCYKIEQMYIFCNYIGTVINKILDHAELQTKNKVNLLKILYSQ